MSSKTRLKRRYEKWAIRRGHRIVAGIDESGVGPLAGPVVAAAVILSEHTFANRIDDCKRLTSKARLSAYEEILRHCIVNVSVIHHGVIDAINIYNASKLAMEKAVIGLPLKPDYLLVDGRRELTLPYERRSIIKGDRRCLSIACASIVAKVWRDRIMERLHELFPCYGFKNHKGYGTAAHFRQLKRYGPSPIHRLSYEPIRQLLTYRIRRKRK